MKSEERHQLEQNVLADWMTHRLPGYRRYVPVIIGALVAVLAVVIGLNFWASHTENKTKTASREFFTRENARQYDALADEYGDLPAGIYARLRAADMRFDEGKRNLLDDRSAAVRKLEEAIQIYQKLSRGGKEVPESVKRQAALGAAMAAETKGATKQAQDAYKEVADASPGTEEARIAKERADALETPEAKRFYELLSEYKPPKADLPEQFGADSLSPLDSLTLPKLDKDSKKLAVPDDDQVIPIPPKDLPKKSKQPEKSSKGAQKPGENTKALVDDPSTAKSAKPKETKDTPKKKL